MITLPRPRRAFRRARRGSVLIVAMIVSAVIAVSLASYLRLSTTSLKLAGRSFVNTAAINVAESGLEQALYALNQNQAHGVALATAWSGWTIDSAAHTAKRTFPDPAASPPDNVFTVAPNASGVVKVYVQNYDLAGAPVIVAKSIVTSTDGSPPISKYIEVRLSRRSLWGYGIVGKDTVRMNSNAKADSWISDSDNNPGTAGLAFPGSGRRDRGSVGVVATGNGAMAMASNAEIYGTANTGGGTVTTSSNVRIYGATSPGTPKVDASRVHRDFAFTFPAITVPTPASFNTVSASWSNNTTIPHPAGTDVADGGVYYYKFAAGHYINLASNRTLTITQPVVLMFENHSGVPSIVMASNANVNVTPAKTVTIYTNGHIVMNSNNSINLGNEAKNFTVYGTHPSDQLFDFDSNVQVYGCVYAPFGRINMDSNTDIFGSVIGKTIQMDSNSEFHYDESLANSGGTGGYRVNRWKELRTSAERATYAAQLDF
jgi:Tfp pilus assembly protein PilX